MSFSCHRTHETPFFLEQLPQTKAVCTLPGVFHPSAPSWARHKLQIAHPRSSTAALWGWGRALNTSPTQAQLCWAGNGAEQSSECRDSPCQPRCALPRNPPREQEWQTVTHFLWDCTRTAFRWERLSLTQMKGQLRSQHLLEWLFCDVPVSKPQKLPWSTQEQESQNCGTSPHSSCWSYTGTVGVK